MTETAELADIVLPAATWGERTGTFTNADRTVHLSEQAVAPPGEARSDLDILLDFARRMDFRDRDGAPLISWDSPEAAFEAWKRCSRGRPCDYSGITYELFRGPSGVQWPLTEGVRSGRNGSTSTVASTPILTSARRSATTCQRAHRGARPSIGQSIRTDVPFSTASTTRSHRRLSTTSTRCC